LVQAQDILKGIDGVSFVYLQKADIVRHRLVKNILDAYDKYQNGNNHNQK
ncbi:MAG: PhoH family protein, partial [Ignavibacteria bacterium]|nr:PhoH family protein [Ignavibacteria bacterium]